MLFVTFCSNKENLSYVAIMVNLKLIFPLDLRNLGFVSYVINTFIFYLYPIYAAAAKFILSVTSFPNF